MIRPLSLGGRINVSFSNGPYRQRRVIKEDFHVISTTISELFCFFFSFKYGGNPVSCAIAIAVMNAVDNELMMENARNVGEHLLSELETMREKFPDVIGDVRGVGLFVGVELVKDPKTKTPATAETREVVDRCLNT